MSLQLPYWTQLPVQSLLPAEPAGSACPFVGSPGWPCSESTLDSLDVEDVSGPLAWLLPAGSFTADVSGPLAWLLPAGSFTVDVSGPLAWLLRAG
jgi:hypothetical protein